MLQETRGGGHPDYGLDAPGLVYSFLIGGTALLGLGLAMTAWGAGPLAVIGWFVILSGGILLVEGLWMVFSSRYGKLRMRDLLLDRLDLRGDEVVLDVGCGHGLLLIGAAKRLPHGRAVGLDLWSQKDQADNRKEATLANARAEGVAGRVEVHDGDMRRMPFASASFDAVVASLSIHNIPSQDGRRDAIYEIVRVLKPGGKVALLDFQHVAQYAEDLRRAGMHHVQLSGLSFWMFPPVRIVTAIKP
jgi:SAM-dependent methyltransferase